MALTPIQSIRAPASASSKTGKTEKVERQAMMGEVNIQGSV